MGWRKGTARDDLAGDKALTNQRKFGKVVDRLQVQGKDEAASNVIEGAGRGDSPEVVQRRIDDATQARRGRGTEIG